MYKSSYLKKPGLGPLDRKIKANPKYASIGSKVDSGPTLDKVKVISTREYLRRKSEVFQRIECYEVASLLQKTLQSAMSSSSSSISNLNSLYHDTNNSSMNSSRSQNNNNYYNDKNNNNNNYNNNNNIHTTNPNTSGEVTVVTYDSEDTPVHDENFLILDIREEYDDFMQSHISHARHYPQKYLNQDRITGELYKYKNRKDSVIVIYDIDGRCTGQTAKQFIDKGFNNVYVLSGGLLAMIDMSPHLVEGRPIGYTEPQDTYSNAGSSLRTGRDSGLPTNRSSFSKNTTKSNYNAQSLKTGRSRRAPSIAGSNSIPSGNQQQEKEMDNSSYLNGQANNFRRNMNQNEMSSSRQSYRSFQSTPNAENARLTQDALRRLPSSVSSTNDPASRRGSALSTRMSVGSRNPGGVGSNRLGFGSSSTRLRIEKNPAALHLSRKE